MPDAVSFETLLLRARTGDEAALAEIAATYERDLRIAARVHLGHALRPYLDSLDLVQSVHRSLMIGLRTAKFDITSPEKLIALALTMVRRKVAHQWRRHRRQTRTRDTVQEQILLECHPASDPAHIAERRDRVEHFWQMLTDEERRILELRLLGHSNVSAAREIGCPPETVRIRLFRLRMRLKQMGVNAAALD